MLVSCDSQVYSFVLSAILLLGACHKKAAPAPPTPPPPPPAKPSAMLSVSPTNVQQGQSVQLAWETQNATEVSIDSLGAVAPTGTGALTPSESTTYTLTAKGPGGYCPGDRTGDGYGAIRLHRRQRQVLRIRNCFNGTSRIFTSTTTGTMSDRPTPKPSRPMRISWPPTQATKFVISGHCDERGSEDYNMALGSSRADGVRDQLVKLGIARDRIKTISYGKEKPFCDEPSEKCWQQNRRAHFSLQQ